MFGGNQMEVNGGELGKDIWTGLLLGTFANRSKRYEKDDESAISCYAINSCSVCSIEASCTVIIITEKFVITNVDLYVFIVNEDLITLI